VVVAKLNELVV